MEDKEINIPNEEQNMQSLQPTPGDDEIKESEQYIEITAEQETAEQTENKPEAVKEPRPVKVSPYADSPYVVNYPVTEPAKPKEVKRAKKGGFWKMALCSVLILALVGGACAATAEVINGLWEDKLATLQDGFDAKLEDLEKQMAEELEKGLASVNTGISVSGTPVASSNGGLTPAQVYAKNVRSVVMIYNRITASYNGQTTTGTATGSGFIITEDGYVVTNYHVIEGEGTISVVTSYSEEYPAKVVGFDQTNDVALLKVEATGLQAVTIGRSSDLIVGDQVVAIGNPLGELTSTLTVGYVSAMERDVTTEGFAINMIQTDAAINSGNSGGPLFNMKGEVIGITTAKYSGTSSSGASIEGVGFAIPSDDVVGILEDLMTHGYITGAYLGVSVSDMNPEAANYYGLPMGAYVQLVEQGYAAQRAGVQPKDIIVKIGDIEVENVNDLTRALRNFSAGEETVIVVYRGGKEMKLPIVLDEKPAS